MHTALVGSILASSTLPAHALDPFEVFELCLDQSVSGVQGAYVDGPREHIREQGRRTFDYRLHVPKKIIDDSKRKMLDAFYYCLEGNGFERIERHRFKGPFVTLEAVRDDRLRARFVYFERFVPTEFGFEESTVTLTIITN